LGRHPSACWRVARSTYLSWLDQFYKGYETILNAGTLLKARAKINLTAPLVGTDDPANLWTSLSVSPASASAPGTMSAAQAAKLDGITAGAGVIEVRAGTAISIGGSASSPIVNVTASSGAADGSMSAANYNKLASIGAGASIVSVGVTAPIVNTGTATEPVIAASAASGASAGTMSSAHWTKLESIGAGATVQEVQLQGALAFGVGSTTAIPIINIPAASAIVPGSMSSAHFSLVNGATLANTASTIVKRGASGEFTAGVITADGLTVSGVSSTFASDVALTPFADTYAANVALRGRDGGKHEITLTGNVTFTAPILHGDGSELKVRVIQGGAGSYTATWASAGAGRFIFLDGLSGTLLATTVGDADYFEFEHWTAPTSHWVCRLHGKYSPP
jgi:hypothetical protein